jgi:hypothetical protein
MEHFSEAVKQFLAAADIQVVLCAVIAARIVEVTFLAPRKLTRYSLWFCVLFAALFTPAFAMTPEVSPGGPLFWRAVIYNSMVAAFFLFQVLPRIRALYTKWFGEMPKNGVNGDASSQ